MPHTAMITSERLGRIVEGARGEVYLFSPVDFRFILVNRGARENLGYTMDELRELTPWDIKPEFEREDFLAYVQPLLSGEKEVLEFETVHRRRDGTDYNVAVNLQLIRQDSEATFYAAIQDVTELKVARRALEETSRQLDAILGNTTMAVFMMDDRQHCVFMNSAAEELTGYTFAETQGRPLHDVIHHTYPDGRHFPIHECAIDRAFPELAQTKGEEIFVHKDGSFYPVGFTASPMKDGSGKPIGTIIEARNIAAELEARRAMEAFNETLKQRIDEAMREREKLEVQLIQAQKMEAVGQLTGGVAHDFNNLLQVIGGNLQLLQRELPEDDPKQRRVKNALAGVRRGAELAAQLLAFGRQQALVPKPVNIGRLVRGMDDMLRRTLGEAIEIETVISGGLWNCMVDATQVENVILNLAINARDAMDGQGTLTIEAGNASLDESYAAAHPDVAPGQYVMLAVSDTGGGIPPEILDKVFDPFFTTKAPGEGTGLGLSMVYGFVKQSKGHVNIYSEPGEGTTVRIYLPRTRRQEQVAPPEPAAIAAATHETILVVEDDDAVRATSVALLTDLGYTVLEAANADNALAIVNSGVKIDLLFTDVVMPGKLRSTELALRARAKLPGLQVLFTSGYTQNAIVLAGRLDEGVELIAKPFTREGVARKIRSILAQRGDTMTAESDDKAAGNEEDAMEGQSDLNILVVEDEILIRITLTKMLEDMGHRVVQARNLATARKELGQHSFDVMIADLGLPDGSGVDLVHEAIAGDPDIAVIVASGRDASAIIEGIPGGERVKQLRKPYDVEALTAVLPRVRVH